MLAEPVAGTTSRAPGTRVHELDWLRVLALAGVFVYHTLRPFDTGDWHVKNPEQSEFVTVLLISLTWGLALFFLLAGAGSALALRRRTPGEYVRERLLRLAVPLLTAYLLLSPVQAYLQETGAGRYHGSVPGFIPEFFRGEWADLRDGPDLPLVVPWAGHLWFLVFLLWFSLLGLPLLVLLRGRAGSRVVGWLGQHANRRGAVLAWAVPLAALHGVLRAPGVDEHGWGEFLVFFDSFLAGALLLSDARLLRAVRRDVRPAGYLAGISAVLVVAIMVTGVLEPAVDVPGSWASAAVWFVVTVWIWAWLNLALGWGLRVRRFGRPLPPPVGAAAMPFFLVHQPVILSVAFFVVRWPAGIAVKWLAVLVSSLTVTVVLATGLCRIPYLSVLFGVKRRKVNAKG